MWNRYLEVLAEEARETDAGVGRLREYSLTDRFYRENTPNLCWTSSTIPTSGLLRSWGRIVMQWIFNMESRNCIFASSSSRPLFFPFSFCVDTSFSFISEVGLLQYIFLSQSSTYRLQKNRHLSRGKKQLAVSYVAWLTLAQRLEWRTRRAWQSLPRL